MTLLERYEHITGSRSTWLHWILRRPPNPRDVRLNDAIERILYNAKQPGNAHAAALILLAELHATRTLELRPETQQLLGWQLQHAQTAASIKTLCDCLPDTLAAHECRAQG